MGQANRCLAPLRARGRCREAVTAFTTALAAAPATAAARERLTLEKGLALRDCGDPAWRHTLEELTAAEDPEVLAQARDALAADRANAPK